MKKSFLILLLFASVYSLKVVAQDTFSIVAVDSVTGEVGSAGASCVDLFTTPIVDDHFLGQLIPDIGAINTQAAYSPTNQNNATAQMNLGKTPDEIIQWLSNNDVNGNPGIRQYGIAAMINGSPQAAALTGLSNLTYANHIVGPNYAIQGNIILGQSVLDSMEARFLREPGDLACKLMAAMQGANVVGADTRCAANGTSSLFAFVKVAQPTDTFGSPSFVVTVRTHGAAGIEPIDSLQIKFDQLHSCSGIGFVDHLSFDNKFALFPNPNNGEFRIEYLLDEHKTFELSIVDLNGKILLTKIYTDKTAIDVSHLSAAEYIIKVLDGKQLYTKSILIK